MARIFISVSGEGRGHATRVRALVDHLKREHTITVFAPGDAFAFLWPLYREGEVTVRRIAGLRFRYSDGGRVDYGRTALAAVSYLRRLPVLYSLITRAVEAGRPDLVVTDFEPALPRVARRLGVPFLSVDHQHFLTTYDLSGLPVALRLHAVCLAAVVRSYFSGEAEAVVSSFYFPPLRQVRRPVTQVGVMLRAAVTEVSSPTGDHLVVYLRRFASPAVLEALRQCGRPVRVYGLGRRPSSGNLQFHAIEERRFLDDLASSAALVSTAGNQLVGEALFLGKPVLALPEPRNFEQQINAHFLQRMGAGDAVPFDRFGPANLRRFLERTERGEFGLPFPRTRLNGVPETLEVIRRHLPTMSTARVSTPDSPIFHGPPS